MVKWTDACRALSTVPGTQQVLTQHIQLVLLVSDPWGPAASSLARSEWALLGTGAPSGGCSPYSHLGPAGKILGSFSSGSPSPATQGESGRGGTGENVPLPSPFPLPPS